MAKVQLRNLAIQWWPKRGQIEGIDEGQVAAMVEQIVAIPGDTSVDSKQAVKVHKAQTLLNMEKIANNMDALAPHPKDVVAKTPKPPRSMTSNEKARKAAWRRLRLREQTELRTRLQLRRLSIRKSVSAGKNSKKKNQQQLHVDIEHSRRRITKLSLMTS